jgi:hypothetical protein
MTRPALGMGVQGVELEVTRSDIRGVRSGLHAERICVLPFRVSGRTLTTGPTTANMHLTDLSHSLTTSRLATMD